MKLSFRIPYSTSWGETLHIDLTYSSSGSRKTHYDMAMHTNDGYWWTLDTSLMEYSKKPVTEISYRYNVCDDHGNIIRPELCLKERIYKCEPGFDYTFHDLWNDRRELMFTYNLPYAHSIITGSNTTAIQVPLFSKTIVFRISAPQLEEGQSIAILGSSPSLGEWEQSRFILMRRTNDNEWIVTLSADCFTLPIEYKYVVIDNLSHKLLAWEEGMNRKLDVNSIRTPKQQISIK